MRRQHFPWIYLVTAIVLTAYGSYSCIFNAVRGKPVNMLGLAFVAVGGIMFLIFIALLIIDIMRKRKEKPEEPPIVEQVEEIEEKPQIEEKKPAKPASFERSYSDEVTYERRSYSGSRDFGGDSGYVKLVGYGPVLRVEEETILDMRSNTYYRIEGNMVMMSGGGPVFEIVGNRIRQTYSGYLYEIVGDNVNKIFGGYYASFSGGYLQTHDLSEKYEVPSMLNRAQKLAVVAILFGGY